MADSVLRTDEFSVYLDMLLFGGARVASVADDGALAMVLVVSLRQ